MDEKYGEKIVALETRLDIHEQICGERAGKVAEDMKENKADHEEIKVILRNLLRMALIAIVAMGAVGAIFALPDVRNWMWDVLPPHQHVHEDCPPGNTACK